MLYYLKNRRGGTVAENKRLEDLMEIVRVLRSEQGCPWDKAQTHETLKDSMIEEAYEVIDAVDQKDSVNLREELGDVLLQVALHSVIAEENAEFTISEVIGDVTDKMIRRHPHVFGTSSVNSVDGVVKQWDEIKRQEHNQKTIADSLRCVPRAMPATMRTAKIQKKVKKAGVGLPSAETDFEWINDTITKLQEAREKQDAIALEEYYGELLFEVINLSTILGLNAENSLTNAVDKFINRFVGIERVASREGKRLSELSVNYENELWRLNNK